MNSSWFYLIVSSILVPLVPVVVLLIQYIIVKKSEAKQRYRERKAIPCEKFVRSFVDLLFETKVKMVNGMDITKGLEERKEYTIDFILWGSNEIIEKWLELRQFAEKGIEQSSNLTAEELKKMEILIYWENMLFAIRKEFGHKKLNQGDLLRLIEHSKKIDQLINESNKIMNEPKKHPY